MIAAVEISEGIEPLMDRWLKLAADLLAKEMPGVVDYARRVTLPDGELAGTAYDPTLHPGQMCTLQAIEAGATWVAIAKPVQDGGSLASFIPVLRRVTLEAQTAMIAYPTREKATDAWRNKLWPILAAQGAQAPTDGSGSRGGVGSTTMLPSGGKIMLRAAGGRHESGQAADTADVLLCDELDDWSDMRRIRLIERRIGRSKSPLLIYVSTVKRDDAEGENASRILRMVESGTATRIEYPCPHCGAYQRFLWDNVNIAERHLVCIHCAQPINETQRLQAIPHWKRVDTNTSERFTILWTALDSPFAIVIDGRKLPVIDGLCMEYEEAQRAVLTGDHGFIRQFFRDRLTRPYTSDRAEDGAPARITCGYLAARSKVSTYALQAGKEVHDEDGDSIHVAERPDGIEFLTITEDVQQGGQRAPGRNYFLVQGWAADRRSWDLSWGSLVACAAGRTPSESELHACLDRVGAHAEEMPKHYGVPLLKRGVDVGDRLPEIRRWLARNPSWLAVRGVESTRKALEGDIQGVLYRRKQDGGWFLYEIDVHEMRQRAQNGFLVPSGSPGAAHLPEGLAINSSLLAHYCATALISDNRNGLRWSDRKEDRKQHGDWQKRRDLLDCRTYGCALAEYQIRDLTKRKPAKRRYGDLGNPFGA